MKNLLALLLLIPSLSWGLTFKDGKQVDGNEKTRDKELKSEEISSDIIGRWRGLANCEWNGRYELGNGIIEGVIDLVIKKDKKDPNKVIIKKEKWLWPSFGGRVKIKSFKVNENSFEIVSKEPVDDKDNTRKWYGKMSSNDHIEVTDEYNNCDALLYRAENVTFEAFTPRIPIDFIDGVENDQKYTIEGFLTYPQEQKEKYPLMILIMNSACDFGQRNFTLGQDIKKAGVATLEIDSCLPRGLSIYNMIIQGNSSKLTPWMGAADALYGLKHMQSHPKINPEKIAVMGFSWGGSAAVYTGLDMIRKPIIDDENLNDFALRIGVYPYCRYLDKQGVTKNKIHFLTGEKDETTPALFCKDMAKNFNDFGGNATIDIFPNAHHNFDGWSNWDEAEFSNQWFRVTKNCKYWLAADGKRTWRMEDKVIHLDNYDTWDVSADKHYKDYKKECEHWGVVEGRNNEAAINSAKKTISLLEEYLM